MPIVVAGKELSALEWHALKVAGAEAKNRRKELPEGSGQAVDFTVRVHGEVHVAQSGKTTDTDAPKADVLLAKILERLGRGPLADADALDGYFRRLQDLGAPGKDAVARAKKILERFTTRTPKPKDGAVTGALTLSVEGH